MNRVQTYQKAIALKAMALSKPSSPAYEWLKHPFLAVPQAHKSTNLEYAYRIVLEGDDIIARGDSLVKTPRFTQHHVLQANRGVKALGRIVTSPAHAHRSDINECASLAYFLNDILTYHIDKSTACNLEKIRLHTNSTNMQESFVNACKTGDYLALAKLYPYIDGLMEIEESSALPKTLQGKMVMPKEWHETQRASVLKSCFGDATSLTPAYVQGFLSRPQTGPGEFAFSALQSDQNRNFLIWKCGIELVNAILTAIDRKPLYHNSVDNLFPRDVAP